jgi:hypothetical protein
MTPRPGVHRFAVYRRTPRRRSHVFLFNGPFAGSVQTGQVRRIVPLTGTLAIVDLNALLTGYVALPPGLSETAPGEVAIRARMVVGKNGPRWEILAQQLTRIAPPPGGGGA